MNDSFVNLLVKTILVETYAIRGAPQVLCGAAQEARPRWAVLHALRAPPPGEAPELCPEGRRDPHPGPLAAPR